MRNQPTTTIKAFALATFTFALTACSGFFDKDNTPVPTPLSSYKQEIYPHQRWFVNVGTSGDEFLKMSPAVSDTAVYTASVKGTVTSVNKETGRINWQINTNLANTTGPGAGDGLVVVGTRYGDVVALNESNGRERWRTMVPGGVLANPAVGQDIVIVKTIDGTIRGLSASNGQQRWSYKQTEPNLILRGASSPLVRDGSTIVGFANGNLAKLSTAGGQLSWIQPIAIAEGGFAIERMIDIDANPIVFQHHLYAATYQGKLASLDWTSGRVLWSHDISTYTGLVADDNTVFLTDAKGHVWAFSADSGLVNWRQTQLEARVLSGPATLGNYVVVGDASGYLHWLGKLDGHFAARTTVGSGGFTAAPIAENNVLYAMTNKGHLVAYTLGS